MKDWIEMAAGVLMIILGAILMSILVTAFYVCAVAVILSPFVLVAWLCVKLFT